MLLGTIRCPEVVQFLFLTPDSSKGRKHGGCSVNTGGETMTWDAEAGFWCSVNFRLLANSLCQAAVCFLLEHGNAVCPRGTGG